MKIYEVEYSRTSYITVTVEAEDQDQAEAKAWKHIAENYYVKEADWAVESVEEITKKGEAQ